MENETDLEKYKIHDDLDPTDDEWDSRCLPFDKFYE